MLKMTEDNCKRSMKNLEAWTLNAIECGMRYMGVLVAMEGFPEPEVIINENANFRAKLDYYMKAYGEDMRLKSFRGIKIIGYTFGDSFGEIEWELLDEGSKKIRAEVARRKSQINAN